MLTEVIDKVQFVVDAKGNKKAAQLDLPIWETLVEYLKEIEEDATEESISVTPSKTTRMLYKQG
jgi:hypothetical protein